MYDVALQAVRFVTMANKRMSKDGTDVVFNDALVKLLSYAVQYKNETRDGKGAAVDLMCEIESFMKQHGIEGEVSAEIAGMNLFIYAEEGELPIMGVPVLW